jgi:hypothetical protein
MRDEQFGFIPRDRTYLQLVHHVERIIRNLGEKTLTGAVFLDVAKTSIPFGPMPHPQANSQTCVLHYPYNTITPTGSEVRRVLPNGHVFSSRHSGLRVSGWIDNPSLPQSVCQ